MIKNYLSILFLFISVSFSYGQVVINELDSDTPGIDDKEFVELKSTVPNFSLDGYVLVFFNGNAESASTGNKSYLTISLNGLTTDANGLVYLAKLPMKKAVGTSIFIIAINSLIGFTGDLGNIDIDWSFLFIFSFISILGIFAGIYLNKFINEKNLKKGFGWFVLTMSILILTKEVFL